MADVRRTREFDGWLTRLADRRANARILTRIDRIALGNPGDVKPVGEGVTEMRIDHGPGYRVYYGTAGAEFVLLLIGGDTSTQKADIVAAKQLWRRVRAARPSS